MLRRAASAWRLLLTELRISQNAHVSTCKVSMATAAAPACSWIRGGRYGARVTALMATNGRHAQYISQFADWCFGRILIAVPAGRLGLPMIISCASAVAAIFPTSMRPCTRKAYTHVPRGTLRNYGETPLVRSVDWPSY